MYVCLLNVYMWIKSTRYGMLFILQTYGIKGWFGSNIISVYIYIWFCILWWWQLSETYYDIERFCGARLYWVGGHFQQNIFVLKSHCENDWGSFSIGFWDDEWKWCPEFREYTSVIINNYDLMNSLSIMDLRLNWREINNFVKFSVINAKEKHIWWHAGWLGIFNWNRKKISYE